MSEHTPGPWTVIEYGDEEAPNLVIHSQGEMRVCFMATPGSNGDPAMIAADARLIAAAPVMLEVLRACEIAIRGRDQDEREAKLLTAIKVAIANATGDWIAALNHEQR